MQKPPLNYNIIQSHASYIWERAKMKKWLSGWEFPMGHYWATKDQHVFFHWKEWEVMLLSETSLTWFPPFLVTIEFRFSPKAQGRTPYLEQGGQRLSFEDPTFGLDWLSTTLLPMFGLQAHTTELNDSMPLTFFQYFSFTEIV